MEERFIFVTNNYPSNLMPSRAIMPVYNRFRFPFGEVKRRSRELDQPEMEILALKMHLTLPASCP